LTTTKTDAQGRLRFEHVRFGRYTLQAAKTGFARMNYGAGAVGRPGRVLTVASDRGVVGLEFKLTPLGIIHGVVVDRNGEPIPGATIVAGFVNPYGAPPAMEALRNVTDDRGAFRLPDLPSGRYYLQAVPPPARLGSRDPGANLPTFYPSVGAYSEAVPVSLAPGQELLGLRITVREAPGFSINGKVTGAPTNIAFSDLDLLLVPRYEGGDLLFGPGYAEALSRRAGGSSAVRSDGTFQLSGLERGVYDLIAVSVTSRDRQPLGRVVVPVGDRDVNGVVLPLDGHVQLSVRLRSDQKIDGVSCSIEGVPLDGSPWGLSIVGRTGPDGVFTTTARSHIGTRSLQSAGPEVGRWGPFA
jgi:hypothetical protein